MFYNISYLKTKTSEQVIINFKLDIINLIKYFIDEFTRKQDPELKNSPDQEQIKLKLFNAFVNDTDIINRIANYNDFSSRESDNYTVYPFLLRFNEQIIIIELYRNSGNVFRLEIKLERHVIRSCFCNDINTLLDSAMEINNWHLL